MTNCCQALRKHLWVTLENIQILNCLNFTNFIFLLNTNLGFQETWESGSRFLIYCIRTVKQFFNSLTYRLLVVSKGCPKLAYSSHPSFPASAFIQWPSWVPLSRCVASSEQVTQLLVSLVWVIQRNCRTVPKQQKPFFMTQLCGNHAEMLSTFLFSEVQHHKEKSTHTWFKNNWLVLFSWFSTLRSSLNGFFKT